jgi:hypothetical protein
LIRGRDPAQVDWFREVERRWSTAVRWKHTAWKLLIGLTGLFISLLSLLSSLRGRWPWWIAVPLPHLSTLVPMLLILFHPQWSQKAPLKPVTWLYVTAYDRPGMLIAALATLAAMLLYRHLRVFSRDEIRSPKFRA